MIISNWDRRRATFGATLCSLLLLLTSCVSNAPAGDVSAEDDLAYRAAESESLAGQNPFGFTIRHQALRRDGLMGLPSMRVAEILGQPRLRRRDWPADLWQYEADGCVMDIVFYDDDPQAGVMHAESRLAEGSGLPGGPDLDDDCLVRIQAQARL